MIDEEMVFREYLNRFSQGSERRPGKETVYYLSTGTPLSRGEILQSETYRSFAEGYTQQHDQAENTTDGVSLESVCRARERGPPQSGESTVRTRPHE